MTDIGERSAFPCPRCGARRLAMITFPEQRTMGYAPAFEIVGMGEPIVMTPPAIGCLGCGAEWPTVDAVRAELGREAAADPPAPERRDDPEPAA
ncbi:MAG: hypothetical protein L0221_04270 [Chloroflexi bacterium]|nr:hypothetical protein [Chloroflexota bacterium]